MGRPWVGVQRKAHNRDLKFKILAKGQGMGARFGGSGPGIRYGRGIGMDNNHADCLFFSAFSYCTASYYTLTHNTTSGVCLFFFKRTELMEKGPGTFASYI